MLQLADRHSSVLAVVGWVDLEAPGLQATLNELQRNPRIASIYSQSAGLATFLMHYDDGRYRGALGRYLLAVYNGKANATTLSDLTGVEYERLDREYRAFLAPGK